MKRILAALVWLSCTAMAQIGGDYLGPGILSSGAGTIGQRSGQPVDLRFFADIMGVYDNGIQPFATRNGQLYTVNGLYGEQVDAGVYGQHSWRQALLGLDLHGNYSHYENGSSFDSGGASATLGYTYQKSRRVLFTMRGVGGTTKLGYGSPGFYSIAPDNSNVVGQQSSVLFDNRIYYLQGGAAMVYVLTPRTSVILGGDAFTSQYSANALIGVYGYDAHGTIQHRLSRTKTVGAVYEHLHFDFVHAYGYSDTDIAQLFIASQLAKRWTFTLNAGGGRSVLQSVEQISLSPVVSALLGTSFGYQTFLSTRYFPAGSARLIGKFNHSLINFAYTKSVTPGNGVYLTSRQDSAGGTYNYTGIHKLYFGLAAGYYHLSGLSQTIAPYNTYGGGGGFTYNLARALHVVGRYDYRHQDITGAGFRRNASRVSLGLAWSPGDHPLSLW